MKLIPLVGGVSIFENLSTCLNLFWSLKCIRWTSRFELYNIILGGAATYVIDLILSGYHAHWLYHAKWYDLSS